MWLLPQCNSQADDGGLVISNLDIWCTHTRSVGEWISNIVLKSDVAAAIGFYTGMQSICTLIASSVAGWLWYAF
jgi:hypothetical protein